MANNSSWDDEAQKRQVEQEFLNELLKSVPCGKNALPVEAISLCVKYSNCYAKREPRRSNVAYSILHYLLIFDEELYQVLNTSLRARCLRLWSIFAFDEPIDRTFLSVSSLYPPDSPHYAQQSYYLRRSHNRFHPCMFCRRKSGWSSNPHH